MLVNFTCILSTYIQLKQKVQLIAFKWNLDNAEIQEIMQIYERDTLEMSL